MESRFYGRITSAEIIRPSGRDLDDVHEAYISMAASGIVTEAQRSVLHNVSLRLLASRVPRRRCWGGTDLALVFNEESAEIPVVDCAAIHADAIARLGLA